MLLLEMVDGSKMRTHKYNIYRQFVEIKWLKANLKEEEVILSVDFSKKYENKQLHEIQSAFLGMKILPFSQHLVTSIKVLRLKMVNLIENLI